MAEVDPFLDMLAAAMHTGETLLLVKQIQFPNPGGGLSENWKAHFPHVARKEGEPWYVSTGVYRVHDLDTRRPSASSKTCTNVHSVVLDDIGTKCPKPTVEPTWIMETSEGNFQYGYLFSRSNQPTKESVLQLVDHLVRQGMTDPGTGKNAVRNVRISGSVNLKPGKNRFRSKLTYINPGRTFTLNQLYTEFEFIRKEEQTGPNYGHDGVVDPVWAWLIREGYVTAAPNSAGWGGVLCPNRDQHTNGNPNARYNPHDRAFGCFHGHCQDWNSARFLEWVREKGGPDQSPSAQADESIKLLREALMALPTKADLVPLPVKEPRNQQEELFHTYIYLWETDSFYDQKKQALIPRKSFNAMHRHLNCKSMHSKKKLEASVWFDENRERCKGLNARNVTYAPGDPMICDFKGDTYVNTWRDARPKVTAHTDAAPIRLWMDHCKALVPDDRTRTHMLDLMAFKVQHPEIKINHAVLHMGIEGCGKDTLWAPLIWAVCGPELHNWGMMDNQTLQQSWGYQYMSEILILNELREVDMIDRKAMANKLKPLIAAPPDHLIVNTKFNSPYPIPNRMFLLAFSNDPVPISLDPNDRRWFCIQSDAPALAPEAGAILWAWFKSGGFEKVAGWLKGRETTAFLPKAAPPLTAYKQTLIMDSQSSVEGKLYELIKRRMGPFAKDVVELSSSGLIDQLTILMPNLPVPSKRQILNVLKQCGWVDRGALQSTVWTEKRRVVVHSDKAAMPVNVILDLVDQTADASLHTPIIRMRN